MAETAPGGVHMAGLPVIAFDGDAAVVKQSFVFFDQHTHEVRIGWYDDLIRREVAIREAQVDLFDRGGSVGSAVNGEHM